MNASSFKISVHRKKDNVYLKLNGDYTTTSAAELLQALENIVMTSMKFSTPGVGTVFSFNTCSRVSQEKMRSAGKDRGDMNELSLTADQEGLIPRSSWRHKQAGAGTPAASVSVLQRLCLVGS